MSIHLSSPCPHHPYLCSDNRFLSCPWTTLSSQVHSNSYASAGRILSSLSLILDPSILLLNHLNVFLSHLKKKISQTQDKYHMIPHIWGIQNTQTNRSRKENSGCQGLGRKRKRGVISKRLLSFNFTRWLSSGYLLCSMVPIVCSAILWT